MGLYASFETISYKEIHQYRHNPTEEFWEAFSPKLRSDLQQMYPDYECVEETYKADMLKHFKGLKDFHQQAKKAELNVITNLG